MGVWLAWDKAKMKPWSADLAQLADKLINYIRARAETRFDITHICQ